MVLSQIEVGRGRESSERKSGPLYIGKGKASMLLKTKENAGFLVNNEPKHLNFCVSNGIGAKSAALGVMIRTRKLVCY